MRLTGSGRSARNRPAFTLVEMLVVIVIILTIAVITAATLPSILTSQKAQRGGNQLSQMLLVAKQMAVRDQVPTGVRMVATTDPLNPTTLIANEFVYVRQPDDLVISGDKLTISGTSAKSSTQDFFGGFQNSANSFEQFPVQAGDYLEVNGGGFVTQITGVSSSSGSVGDTLGLTTSIGAGTPTTVITSYRIIRMPRRVPGEDSVKLPQDVVVQLWDFNKSTFAITTRYSVNVPVRTMTVSTNVGTVTVFVPDIIFAPGGGVIGAGTPAGDKSILFVRDASRDNLTDGEPVLVSVNVRTGAIAVNPVDISSGDFYSFTRDPSNSGM